MIKRCTRGRIDPHANDPASNNISGETGSATPGNTGNDGDTDRVAVFWFEGDGKFFLAGNGDGARCYALMTG